MAKEQNPQFKIQKLACEKPLRNPISQKGQKSHYMHE
jgi:hypothetical protein